MDINKIWNTFKTELLGFIKSRIADQSIAEDILQEVFIKILTKKDTLKDDSKLASWVYQITRHKIIDHYRVKKIIDYKDEIEGTLPEEVTPFNQDFLCCLKPFINQLENNYKEAIIKTTFDGLSQKEFAAIKGLSYSAAKSRVQRARQKLKESFTTCCQFQFDKYGNILPDSVSACNCQ